MLGETCALDANLKLRVWCGVAADLRRRAPSVNWSGNWRRRRILPRDRWLSDSCQCHSR